jgi:hypothetical protein
VIGVWVKAQLIIFIMRRQFLRLNILFTVLCLKHAGKSQQIKTDIQKRCLRNDQSNINNCH